MYRVQQVPLTDAVRGELLRIIEGTPNRYLLALRYAMKAAAWSGLVVAGLCVLTFAIDSFVTYAFPTSNWCRTRTPALNFKAVPWLAGIAAVVGAGFSRFEWAALRRQSMQARADLDSNVGELIECEIADRHLVLVLANDDEDGGALILMQEGPRKTRVLRMGMEDPRQDIIVQQERRGRAWSWTRTPALGRCFGLSTRGEPIALADAEWIGDVWIDENWFGDAEEDGLPVDGQVLDQPLAHFEQLVAEMLTTEASAASPLSQQSGAVAAGRSAF